MWGLILKFWWSRIKKQGFYGKIIFVFRKNDVVQSDIHTVDQCCGAVFCLNCQLRQASNKCKSIFSVSNICPACAVYVAFACHVPKFSQVNHQLQQARKGESYLPNGQATIADWIRWDIIAVKDPSKVFPTKKGKIKLFLDPPCNVLLLFELPVGGGVLIALFSNLIPFEDCTLYLQYLYSTLGVCSFLKVARTAAKHCMERMRDEKLYFHLLKSGKHQKAPLGQSVSTHFVTDWK